MNRTKWVVAAIGCFMVVNSGAMAQIAPAEAVKPATPEKEAVRVGTGSMTISGLLQGWYQFTDSATPADDTFRLRRAEIKLSGEVDPAVAWAVMIDPAQVREDDVTTATGTNLVTSVGRKSVLQDFLVTYKLDSANSLDVGQYKTPFGMEGLESSAKLDLIERSMMASQLKWADYRDVGVTYKGNFTCPFTGAKIQPTAGIYNGEGQNKLDGNNPMAYAGRLVVKPVESLHLGVSHYNGEKGSGSAAKDDNRTGVEAKFTMDPVSVYGEYATGESGGKDKEEWYATVTCNLGDAYQAVARYDWYDADKNTDNDARTETTVGLNYFIKKHNAKLAANYVVVGEEGASVDNDIVRVLAQVSF